MGRQVFTAGEILTAANMNDLSDQTVMVFDDATDRATAIPTPVEGMTTYLKDTDEVTVFDGSAFKAVGPGKILQVVQVVKTDTFTMSADSLVDITGLTLNITPTSTNSKVFVLANVSLAAFNTVGFVIARGGTPILLGDTAGSRQRVTGGAGAVDSRGLNSPSASFLDSPSSTSALTYSIQLARGEGETIFVNRSQDAEDRADRKRGTSSLTLMEVAG